MIEYLLFAIGLIILIKGSSYLIDNSSKIAKKYNVPNIVIGLTIVAFGTSLPEFIVNIFSIIEGSSDIAVGNIVGSNIANILLVLGIIGVLGGIKVKHSLVKKEIPIVIFSALVLLVLSLDFITGQYSPILSRLDGILLLISFVAFIGYIFVDGHKGRLKLNLPETEEKLPKLILFVVLGILGLFLGGQLVVNSAITIAKNFGISEFIISATIIAIGTSLPEIITSVMAIIKKNVGLSVGNIIGSNIFNTFLVLGASSTISPLLVSTEALVSIIFSLIVGILLLITMFVGTKYKFSKVEGVTFILLYISYILFLTIP